MWIIKRVDLESDFVINFSGLRHDLLDFFFRLRLSVTPAANRVHAFFGLTWFGSALSYAWCLNFIISVVGRSSLYVLYVPHFFQWIWEILKGLISWIFLCFPYEVGMVDTFCFPFSDNYKVLLKQFILIFILNYSCLENFSIYVGCFRAQCCLVCILKYFRYFLGVQVITTA